MDTVCAELRSPGTKVKTLRKAGLVPCCIYGAQLKETLSVQLAQGDVEKLLRTNGKGSRLTIVLGKQHMKVLLKDIGRDTVLNTIEHLGFQALAEDRRVNSSAKIVLQNKDKVPGYVSQVLFRLPYTALPEDLTDTVTVDLTGMEAGARMAVRDLSIARNPKIELLAAGDSMVFNIVAKRTPQRRAEEE